MQALKIIAGIFSALGNKVCRWTLGKYLWQFAQMLGGLWFLLNWCGHCIGSRPHFCKLTIDQHCRTQEMGTRCHSGFNADRLCGSCSRASLRFLSFTLWLKIEMLCIKTYTVQSTFKLTKKKKGTLQAGSRSRSPSIAYKWGIRTDWDSLLHFYRRHCPVVLKVDFPFVVLDHPTLGGLWLNRHPVLHHCLPVRCVGHLILCLCFSLHWKDILYRSSWHQWHHGQSQLTWATS